MAEFGKRQSAGVARPSVGGGATFRPSVTSATPEALAAAAEVVAKGKMPAWTKMGPSAVIGLTLFVACLTLDFAYHYGGGILRDHRFSGTWQPAYDLQVTDGRCHRVQLVFTNCDVAIKSLADGEQPALEFEIALVGGDGELLIPMRSTRDPSAVTIAYFAENELANRTLTFVSTELMFAAATLALLHSLKRGRYKGGAKHLELLAGLENLEARMERAPLQLRAGA